MGKCYFRFVRLDGKNTYNEFDQTYQKYMIGVCLKLREDLQYMDCQTDISKE